MAFKVKKGKRFSRNKIVRARRHLHLQFLNIWGNENTSFGTATKSWSSIPRHCNPMGKYPWPQLSAGQHYNTYLFDASSYNGFIWWLGRRPPRDWDLHSGPINFVGFSHGALLCHRPELTESYAWNPAASSWYEYTDFNKMRIPFSFVTLFSSPSNPNGCIVIKLKQANCPVTGLYGLSEGGEFTKMRQDWDLVDPFASHKQLMQLTNAIGFGGKLYALSLQGTLAVVEGVGSQLSVTAISRSRGVPSVASRHFREYLVDSDGEIWLLFLISRKSIDVVDDVEVFSLRLPRLTWAKMESLGDRALVAGVDSCASLTASVEGCKSNCIYFQQHAVDGWWLYEMESRSITCC